MPSHDHTDPPHEDEYRSLFAEQEWRVLGVAAIRIAFGVGIADGELDTREEDSIVGYIDFAAGFPNGLPRQVLLSLASDWKSTMEAANSQIDPIALEATVRRAASLATRRAPASEAIAYRYMLYDLGDAVARASGRRLRRRISSNERDLLAQIAVWLEIDIGESTDRYTSPRPEAEETTDDDPPDRSDVAAALTIEEIQHVAKLEGFQLDREEAEMAQQDLIRNERQRDKQRTRSKKQPRLRRTHEWARGAHVPTEDDDSGVSATEEPIALYGDEIIQHVYAEMKIDAEWARWSDTGYSWWGGNLRQQVRGIPVAMQGTEFVAVVASTDLLRDVSKTAVALEGANNLNMSAGLSSIVVDTDAGTVRMAASVIAHPGVMDYRERFKIAAAYQADEAHRLVEPLAESLGGAIDQSGHPANGPRTSPDEMLRLIENMPLRESPVPLHRKEFEEALADVPFPCDWPLVVHSNVLDHGIVVDYPFYHAIPAMRLDLSDPATHIGTAILTLSVRDREADKFWASRGGRINGPSLDPRHTGAYTRYGNGLHIRLELPVVVEDHIGIQLAAELNQLEATGTSMNNLLGSWYAENNGLWFTAYYPNLVLAPRDRWLLVAMLMDLVVSFSARTQWARTVLEDRIPPPNNRRQASPD